jgi:tetratricopeptide (TPR) repeat protein
MKTRRKKKNPYTQAGKKGDGAPAKDQLWPVLMVFLLAILVRGIYLYQSRHNPTFSAPLVDAMTYDQMARKLASGEALTNEFFWQPIFYPLFLSAVYRLSNSSILCAKILQILLGSVTCVLVYRLGERIFGKAGGIWAGLICAVYMPMVFFEGELLAAGWAAFWAVAIILALLRTSQKPALTNGFVLGAACALSILTRSVFLPFIGAACVWLIIAWMRRAVGIEKFLLSLVGAAAGFFIVAGPVMAISRRVMGKATILPYSGGINFYIGNNPNYKETITIRPGIAWRKLTELPAEQGIDDKFAAQRFFFEKAKEYITTQPLSYLKGLCYKTAQFFNSREMPRNVDIYLFRKWSGVLSLGVFKTGRFGFPFGLLLPLAAAGAIYWRRKIPAPIWLFAAIYPASVILVFVTSRYRVPIVPIMSVLAAGGCLMIQQLIKEGRYKKFACIVVVLVGTGLAAGMPGPFYAEQLNFEPELYYGLGDSLDKRDRTTEAIEAYSKAITLRPLYTEAHHNLGLLLADDAKFEEAIAHYNAALKVDPENAGVHDDLGLALSKLGKAQEAIKHYNEAIRIDPKSASAHDNLGTALFRLGQMLQAIEHYSKAIALKPDDSVSHNNIGNVYAMQGEPEKALQHYEKSLNLKPDDPETLNNMANALAALKKFPEAAQKYRQALEVAPDDAGIYCNLGICLKQQGQIDEAIEAFDKAIAIDPQNKRAQQALQNLGR